MTHMPKMSGTAKDTADSGIGEVTHALNLCAVISQLCPFAPQKRLFVREQKSRNWVPSKSFPSSQ